VCAVVWIVIGDLPGRLRGVEVAVPSSDTRRMNRTDSNYLQERIENGKGIQSREWIHSFISIQRGGGRRCRVCVCVGGVFVKNDSRGSGAQTSKEVIKAP